MSKTYYAQAKPPTKEQLLKVPEIQELIEERVKEILSEIIEQNYDEDFKTYDHDSIAEAVIERAGIEEEK